MSGDERPPSPRPIALSAANRVAVIVEAAERAAEGLIEEAEREARRYVDEAQALANRLAAERLRELADELDPPGDGGEEAPRLRPVEGAELNGVPDDGEPRRPGTTAARLLATQLAVQGASREEIAARLRSQFAIEDPSAVLDAILGQQE